MAVYNLLEESTEGILNESCGCFAVTPPDYIDLTLLLVEAYQLAGNPLPRVVSDAFDIIFRTLLAGSSISLISATAEEGYTLTDSRFTGKEVVFVFMNGQAYTRTNEFTQNDDETGDGKGDTITMNENYPFGNQLVWFMLR